MFQKMGLKAMEAKQMYSDGWFTSIMSSKGGRLAMSSEVLARALPPPNEPQQTFALHMRDRLLSIEAFNTLVSCAEETSLPYEAPINRAVCEGEHR